MLIGRASRRRVPIAVIALVALLGGVAVAWGRRTAPPWPAVTGAPYEISLGGVGPVLFWLGIAVLYRVIRTAVAHGFADAEDQRRRKADKQGLTEPIRHQAQPPGAARLDTRCRPQAVSVGPRVCTVRRVTCV